MAASSCATSTSAPVSKPVKDSNLSVALNCAVCCHYTTQANRIIVQGLALLAWQPLFVTSLSVL